jgi:uncharacterized membrane protein YbhN (UPF0104 family)
VALALAWAGTDPRAILAALAGLGPAALLVPLPWVLALGCDAAGWGPFLPEPRDGGPSFVERMRLRLSAEAVGQTVPSAGLAGEALAVLVLRTRFGVPVAGALGAAAARKVCLTAGHAAALVLGLATYRMLAAGRAPRLLGALLPIAAAATLAAALLGWAALDGRFLDRRRRAWLRRRTGLRTGGARPPLAAAARSTGAYLALYLAEAGETALFLALLGARAGFPEVLSFDALVALGRALAFFVPAGLGVQELGYVFLFRATGLPDAESVGAAFVLLKRAREAFWTGMGYALMAVPGPGPARPAEALGAGDD